MARRRWSRKVTRRFAQQRDNELRAWYQTKIKGYSLDQLIFIDESAANERAGFRRFGWSPIGTHCNHTANFNRQKRWTVLPALSVNGYLNSPLIFQGSVTQELFVWWLRNSVIPQLRPDQVVVMDNASVHHGEPIQQLIKETGLVVIYLPPYSPDYNPIEQTFNVLKAWIRRHIHVAKDFSSFGDFLSYAVEACGEEDDALSHYRDCGYE